MPASMASKPRADLEAGNANGSRDDTIVASDSGGSSSSPMSSPPGIRDDMVVAGDSGGSLSSPTGVDDVAVAANAGDQLAISYKDAKIDAILADIDKAVPNSAPSHLSETGELKDFCHDAVCTMREFRDEILELTTDILTPEGDFFLLHPGTGPKKLFKALRDVLLYIEASSAASEAAIDADTARFGISVQRTPATLSNVVCKVSQSVLFHVNQVLDTAQKRLEIVSGLVGGPMDIRTWMTVAIWVMDANGRVNESMVQRLNVFYINVEGQHHQNRTNEILVKILRKQDDIEKRMKDMEQDLRSLTLQIAEVLKEMDAIRIHQEEGTCPQGFILIPTDKTTWSLVKTLNQFNLYARDVQLFFVCRMFFEELEAAANVADAMYEHEFSDPMSLELPRDVVREHQHLIGLSVKIVNVLVKATALGCGTNLIPHVGLPDHNELLTALQTDLLQVQAQAEKNSSAADGWNVINMSRERMRKVLSKLHLGRSTDESKPSKKRLMKACKTFQDYLEKRPNPSSSWQDKVRPKLVCTKKHGGKEYGYICKENDKHLRKWTQAP